MEVDRRRGASSVNWKIKYCCTRIIYVVTHLCVFPDPGASSPSGRPALVGQDGALAGHEVLGGEVVQLPGKPPNHLLLRPAASQRHGPESRIQSSVCFNSFAFKCVV